MLPGKDLASFNVENGPLLFQMLPQIHREWSCEACERGSAVDVRDVLDQVCNLCAQNGIVMMRLQIGMRLADDRTMGQLLTDLHQFHLDGITPVQPQVLHDRHHALNPNVLRGVWGIRKETYCINTYSGAAGCPIYVAYGVSVTMFATQKLTCVKIIFPAIKRYLVHHTYATAPSHISTVRVALFLHQQVSSTPFLSRILRRSWFLSSGI